MSRQEPRPGRSSLWHPLQERRACLLPNSWRKLSLRTDVEQVLAAGYFLEVMKKMESFTSAEIHDTIEKEAKTPPPMNTSHVIGQQIKKGH